MHRFSCSENFGVSKSISLPSDQAQHLIKVLRLKQGDRVELVNGRGQLALASVSEIQGKRCLLTVERVETSGTPSRIRICFGVPKAAAADFLIRRTAELGVESFQPLVTAHSLHPDHFNEERWTRVIAEVSKQCQQVHFPVLLPLKNFSGWLSDRDTSRPIVLCDEALRTAQDHVPTDASGYDLLIGAEGGWSREEIDSVASQKPVKLGLGANRLRAETAALVATALLKKAVGEI